MITGSSNFIGIVTAGFDNPFRSKLLAPLVHQLALNGFMPLLMNADDPQQLAPSLKQLLSYHVAGVIITSGAPPLSLAEEYLERKIPVTLINRHAELAGCDRVSSDNAQGAKLVADLFSQRRWQQVGFLGEDGENFSTRQRYEAFIAHAGGMQVSTHFCASAGYQAGFDAPGGCCWIIPACRRCFAPLICWPLGRWTACVQPNRAPRSRPLSASMISPRPPGNPINSRQFSRIRSCWRITPSRCW
ncbi:Transcriptional regulator, LacI family [Raoultella terrigena]|uniref:Transcriptional regulator, LacI family n=1 Tax=Raoultella terrigena TaxID=577 RepID=A0A7Z8ZCZ8_RAOTE|nr:Transcriptional regulator, LacI family [Raoultella terrigena]